MVGLIVEWVDGRAKHRVHLHQAGRDKAPGPSFPAIRDSRAYLPLTGRLGYWQVPVDSHLSLS